MSSSEGNGQYGSAIAPGKDDERKLFVGGLSWETTEKELSEYFGKFGEIESINVKTDPNTGRSRGFAFVVFTSTHPIDQILNGQDHVINGRRVDPKRAKARTGKIFVGGLKPEMSDDDIKNFFSQFGKILEVEMPFDKQRNQRKGFCFITFEQEQTVYDLLRNPQQQINGYHVDIRKAMPKPGELVPGGRGSWSMRGTRESTHVQKGKDSSQGGGYGGYDAGYGNYGGGYGNYNGYDYGYGYGGYGDDDGYGSGRSQRGSGRSQQMQSRHQPY